MFKLEIEREKESINKNLTLLTWFIYTYITALYIANRLTDLQQKESYWTKFVTAMAMANKHHCSILYDGKTKHGARWNENGELNLIQSKRSIIQKKFILNGKQTMMNTENAHCENGKIRFFLQNRNQSVVQSMNWEMENEKKKKSCFLIN